MELQRLISCSPKLLFGTTRGVRLTRTSVAFPELCDWYNSPCGSQTQSASTISLRYESSSELRTLTPSRRTIATKRRGSSSPINEKCHRFRTTGDSSTKKKTRVCRALVLGLSCHPESRTRHLPAGREVSGNVLGAARLNERLCPSFSLGKCKLKTGHSTTGLLKSCSASPSLKWCSAVMTRFLASRSDFLRLSCPSSWVLS